MAKKTKADEIHETLVQAIKERRTIVVKYDGGEERYVEPYLYGVSSTDEGIKNNLLRGYQIGGFSNTDKTDWKLFDASKITDIRLAEKGERVDGKGVKDVFTGKRMGYNANDPQITGKKYAKVTF